MLFQTTDDRLKKLEKRVDEIEKQINKTLSSINDAFITITDVITKIQKDNEGLKKEKSALSRKQKQIEEQIRVVGIKRDIKESVIEPVKNIVAENFEFIQEVAKEGLSPGTQDLLKLVEKEGAVAMRDAATKLKVHELQVEHWADMLKDQIAVTEKKNKKYLSKIKAARKS